MENNLKWNRRDSYDSAIFHDKNGNEYCFKNIYHSLLTNFASFSIYESMYEDMVYISFHNLCNICEYIDYCEFHKHFINMFEDSLGVESQHNYHSIYLSNQNIENVKCIINNLVITYSNKFAKLLYFQ